MSSTGAPLYLYGIVRSGSLGKQAPVGLDGERVEEIAEGPVAAVASAVRLRDGVVDATRERLTAHLGVLQQLAERITVVPLRFGTVSADVVTVRERILAPEEPRLQRLLHDLDGMIEVDVKAYFRDEAVLPEIVRENPPILRLDARIRQRPGAASYQDRIHLGELVVAALAEKAEREGRDLLRRLGRAAAVARAGPLDTERMVLNAAFLVPRDRLAEFDRAVAGLEADEGARLRVKAVGPLPPSSFASLEDEGGRVAASRRKRRWD